MTTLRTAALLALMACFGGRSADDDPSDDPDTDTSEPTLPTVTCTTSLGAFTVELAPDDAPLTVENFLQYVDEGFYDGSDGLGATLFHRVIPGFMAQGGGVLASGALKATRAPIPIESDNGRSNQRGTIAMARTNDPNSATSQFFINVVDNPGLDYQGAGNPGYAVFGTIRGGMAVIDDIVAQPRNSADRPDTDIVIQECTRID